jgi:hypothetical protein
VSPGLDAWNDALADVLLPAGVSLGGPVRLACDDGAVAAAGRRLGVDSDPAGDLTASLRDAGLLDDAHGLRAAARVAGGDPPQVLAGLAVLVLAASRMASDEQATMQAYYARLCDLLGVAPAPDWPQVRGVPELVKRFADLAAWLAGPEQGRRGLLDLPPDVHPGVVGVPINQALLRAGDRAVLGAFFERVGRLLDAGWDPVHQLRAWARRHQLTVPVQRLLDRPDLHDVLASALRAAHAAWDGSTVGADGRLLLAGQLTLHLASGRLMLSVVVPALAAPTHAAGPGGTPLLLDAQAPAAVELGWLALAADGPVVAAAEGRRVRLLPGPVILFEVTDLGIRAVAAAAEDPVWALTCDEALIAAATPEQQMTAGALPSGWVLLCDVEPNQLPDELRVRRPSDQRPRGGIGAVGGLRLAPEVWLVDHPPLITSELSEPAPVAIDEHAHGDAEPGNTITLETIAHKPGVHHVDIGGDRLCVELVDHGPRQGLGELAVDADPRRVFAGPKPTAVATIRVRGALVEPPAPVGELPLIVRYRNMVDIIDVDGAKRSLGPPPPAAWLDHVGLPADGPWEIPDPSRAAWVCVDAPGRRFVVARAAIDVPLTDDVADVVDWYGPDVRIIDRSGGGAADRWRRLGAALEAETA